MIAENHLNELRASSFAVLSEQSLPPKPSLHTQVARQLMSKIVQGERLLPEGSK